MSASRCSRLALVNSDVLYFISKYPSFLSIGCNQGQVNTFEPIDVSTLSNGAYTAAQVAANPWCFGTAFALGQLPSMIGLPLAGVLLAPLVKLLNGVLSQLSCPAMPSVNMSPLEACPGFALYDGPTAATAPGAVQT